MSWTKEQALNDYIEFLKFPSVSTEPKNKEDLNRCANWLNDYLNKMGLNSAIHETQKHPIVIAQNKHVPGKKTVLIYGHYDVQPVDPVELWDTPPFEPTIKGDYIFARGATDNKGQMMAHIQGIKQYLENNKDLPVNLTFLFEGEEEIGSPNLKPFIENNKELLKCDIIAVSDTGMIAPGQPTMTYGLRGIACSEVFIEGPNMDLHSGVYGGILKNPISAAADIISSLHDQNGKVTIEGFYDNVQELQDWEHKAWSQFADLPQKTKDFTGVEELLSSDPADQCEKQWAMPTAEINGVTGGYQGEGSKTIIPSTASFKVSFRLVPGQKPERITQLFEEHIHKLQIKGVKIKVESGHDGSAYLNDPQSEYSQAAIKALENSFDKKATLIREGGSIPIINDFKRVLGADTLMLGLALPDCRMHSPNENFLLDNYYKGIQMSQELLTELSKV